MNKIKLCIFDMDGLLLDSERHVWSVGEEKIAKKYGKEMTDEIITEVMGANHSEYRRILKEKFGEDFPIVDYQKELFEYYADACKNGNIPLRPSVIELFKFLKENNIYISLGTSTEKRLAKIALENTGILKYFDYIVCGDEVKVGKPEPEIYLKSVEHFGLKPEECIVFEDTPVGAKAAYNGGINLIMVPDIKKPTDLDKKKALAIINSLQEAIPIIKKINKIN